MKIQLTNFSKRHFKKSFTGTKILDLTEDEFEKHINLMSKSTKLTDGYAPFCKLLIIPNVTAAKTGTMKLTLDNFHYLRTGYSARNEDELAVLSRWLEIPYQFIPRAEYLVIVLYSYEQLLNEKNEEETFELKDNTDYGIVAILGQMSDKEEPMKPSTMIRNAMGIEHGGSGVELDTEQYQKSVDFWNDYVTIK